MTQLIKHGGNVHAVAREQQIPIHKVIDYSASINPLGLPAGVRRALVRAIPCSIHYPDPIGNDLRTQIGAIHKIDPESIVLGNGSAELISLLPRALSIRCGLVIGPTFMEFERALSLAGADCLYVHARAEDQYDPPIRDVCNLLSRKQQIRPIKKTGARDDLQRIDTVFLCNPNSPTGRALPVSIIYELLEAVLRAKVRLIIDEAFVDFCGSHSVLAHIREFENLIVLRSFTKFFAMPGLRIGYLVGSRELVHRMRETIPPWSVNNLAQAAAMAALDDKDYRQQSLAFMRQERVRFGRLLRQIPGVRLYPSQANFFLLELPHGCVAEGVTEWCRARRFLVRNCQGFAGINPNTLRLAIRRPQENDRLVKVLARGIIACR